MTTYLVTGGTGLVGAYVTKQLIERGDDVVVYDVKPPGSRMKWVLRDVWDKVTFESCSILDFPSLLKTIKDHQVEKIAHMAALYRPMWETEHPYVSLQITIEGTMNVCEAARLLNGQVKRVVFAGSAANYAHSRVDYSTEPLDIETCRVIDSTKGTSPYGTGKTCALHIGLCYWEVAKVDFVGLIFGKIWGFGAKAGTSEMQGIIPERAVDGLPTTVRNGDATTAPHYVKDHARGVILGMDAPSEKLTHRLFNLSGGEESSYGDVARIVKELIPEAKIRVMPGGVSRRPYEKAKQKEQLGFVPEYTLRDAVADYIAMYRQYKASEYFKEELPYRPITYVWAGPQPDF